MTDVREVVVVGAGPAGLALVLALRRLGVDAIALDRGDGPTRYPKARVVTTRSMELLRRLGVVESVRAAAVPGDWCSRVIVAGTIAGPELVRVEAPEAPPGLSPETPALCTQDRLEAILAAALDDHPGEPVRWRTEAFALEPEARGVAVSARTDDGRPVRIRGRYVVCADGIRGLGAGPAVPGAGRRQFVGRQVSVRVRLDLRRWTSHRPAFVYYVTRRGISAQLHVVDGEHDWVFGTLAQRSDTADTYDDGRAREFLASVLGVDADGATIADVRFWDLAHRLADTFRHGRILRAGDAAHETLPTGAMGMNLALADADALAWRLAAVVRGWGAPALLDDYDRERRPAAQRVAAWTRGNLNAVARLLGAAARDDDEAFRASAPSLGSYVDEVALDLGPLFGSDPDDEHVFVDDGRPGSRAPHIRLGAGRSTLDLYGAAPVLLVDTAHSETALRGRRAGALAQVPLAIAPLGDIPAGEEWWSRHGVGRDGAVLVRPDGYVWWRSADEPSAGELASALSSLAGRASVVETVVA